MLHIILNIHTAPTQIPFARVLGFRKESSELLSRIKQHSRIPLITKLADAQNLLDSEGNQILSETVFLPIYMKTSVSENRQKILPRVPETAYYPIILVVWMHLC